MITKLSNKFLDIIRDLKPGKSFEHSPEAAGKHFWFWLMIIGFAAGALGGLLVFLLGAKLFAPQSPAEKIIAPLAEKAEEWATAQPKKNDQASFERLAAAAISLYKKGPTGSETVPLENFLQSGVALTSDGWVATVKTSALTGEVGAVWNRKFYPVEKILFDDFTDLVFIKIKASGLPVLPFGDLTKTRLGEDCFAADGQGGLYLRRLINARLYSANSLLRSSEKLDVLAGIEEVPAGAPFLNSRGELLGLALAGGKMIPADFIESGLKAILKEGKLTRPALGARYSDLSAGIFMGEPKQGALLKSSKDGKAVIKDSPAEKAGLKEGDIILSVDNFELNQNRTLAELIAGSTPGTKVVLTVLRENKEVKINITL